MSDISEALGGDFDPKSVPAAEGFDVLPAGWYTCEITKAEVQATKKGDGKLLSMELTIVGEQFAGRKFFPRINLQNPSAKAVEIGMRELAGLGQSCGLLSIKDSAELIGKIVGAKVKIEHREGRDPENNIQAYRPVSGANPTTRAQESANAPAPATETPKTEPAQKAAPTTSPTAKLRPWERK